MRFLEIRLSFRTHLSRREHAVDALSIRQRPRRCLYPVKSLLRTSSVSYDCIERPMAFQWALH